MHAKAENSAPSLKRKILLVDDHPIVRAGFSQLLDLEPDLQVCAQAANSSETLEALQKFLPDLAIIDISLDGSNGLELIKCLQALYPALPLLVLSMHPETIYAQRALRAGAKGYIMKEAPTAEVIRAIRVVLRGEIYLSNRMNEVVVNKLFSRTHSGGSPVDLLTDRELEIFELIGQGIKTSEIARKLNLSIKTVETHRAHIKEKLHLNNAMDLVSHAVRWNTRCSSGVEPDLRP
jgi:DNA-binding NarL/FixJ family response regulator